MVPRHPRITAGPFLHFAEEAAGEDHVVEPLDAHMDRCLSCRHATLHHLKDLAHRLVTVHTDVPCRVDIGAINMGLVSLDSTIVDLPVVVITAIEVSDDE